MNYCEVWIGEFQINKGGQSYLKINISLALPPSSEVIASDFRTSWLHYYTFADTIQILKTLYCFNPYNYALLHDFQRHL